MKDVSDFALGPPMESELFYLESNSMECMKDNNSFYKIYKIKNKEMLCVCVHAQERE